MFKKHCSHAKPRSDEIANVKYFVVYFTRCLKTAIEIWSTYLISVFEWRPTVKG